MEIKRFLYNLLSGFFGGAFTVEVEQEHRDYSITVTSKITGITRGFKIDVVELSKMYTEEGSIVLGNRMFAVWYYFYKVDFD